MSDLFRWQPRLSSSNEITYPVDAVKFGDGYEQRNARGKRPILVWELEFQGSPNTIRQIKDYLNDRGALHAFQFQDPEDDKIRMVVCDRIRLRPLGHTRHSLSASFREVVE